MRKVLLVIFIFTCVLSAKAQPGVGCLRNLDGLLYTEKNVLGFYELVLAKYPTSPPACPRVQLGTKTGNICKFTLTGPNNDEYNYILYTATGPYQCDIDHYGVAAILFVGFLGLWKLRKT